MADVQNQVLVVLLKLVTLEQKIYREKSYQGHLYAVLHKLNDLIIPDNLTQTRTFIKENFIIGNNKTEDA